jgi:hypothetical protein
MAMIEPDEITAPAHWAAALINDDWSGMEKADAERCNAFVSLLESRHMYVVSIIDDSERFTWRYALYDPASGRQGGTVADYVVHVRR